MHNTEKFLTKRTLWNKNICLHLQNIYVYKITIDKHKTDVTRAIFFERPSQTLRLWSCTLWLCRINKHGFCTTFPISRSSFTNAVPKWWNCSIIESFLNSSIDRRPTLSLQQKSQSHAPTLSRDFVKVIYAAVEVSRMEGKEELVGVIYVRRGDVV